MDVQQTTKETDKFRIARPIASIATILTGIFWMVGLFYSDKSIEGVCISLAITCFILGNWLALLWVKT